MPYPANLFFQCTDIRHFNFNLIKTIKLNNLTQKILLKFNLSFNAYVNTLFTFKLIDHRYELIRCDYFFSTLFLYYI